MLDEQLKLYINRLPVGPPPPALQEDGDADNAVKIDSLPSAVISGSNMIQFPDDADPKIKASIALSLLAAQRVAQADQTVTSPQQWIDRHNAVLSDLKWKIGDSVTVN